MACFPRFFHRQKTSFNLAEDNNNDTILNDSDNPVQIGRYIRREETPVFTPKNSKRSANLQQQRRQSALLEAQQQQFKQQENEETTNHCSDTAKNNNNKISNSNNTNNNSGKKFISKKSNGFYASNYNSNNSATTRTNANNVSAKFKPVKERRPTALPSEVPHIEEDAPDCSLRHFEAEADLNGYNTPPHTPSTPTPSTTGATTPTSTPANVKFYLSLEDETIDGAPEPHANGRASCTSATHANADGMPRLLSLISPPLVSNYSALTRTTTTATTPPTTTTHLKLKLPSNTSNKSRKGPVSPRVQELQQLEPPIYIPPPPPLPPRPLTTAASNVSLASLKSAKAQRSSGGDFNSNAKASSNSSSIPNGDAKLSHDLHTCTIQEVLNISNSTTRTTTSGNSLNGRDSGVQVEDHTPSPSPKDSQSSETPKSHRLEGGLIFTRSNLPIRKDVHIEYIEKSEDTRNLIRSAIEKNEFLNNYMDKERKDMVIDAMEPATYEKDHYIIYENDEGSEIYVSEEGDFEVLKGHKVVNSFGTGTVFGELAILYNAKRLASVRVATYARVWKLEREKFRKIMVVSGSKEREENLNFLRSAPFLSDLEERVLDKVVDLLQRKFYETGICIVREGEDGNEFFIIRGGTVTIKKLNEDGEERVVARRKRGDYFGEQALLNADRRQASVYADAPGTEVLKLDREAFISYLGTIPEMHEKPGERQISETRESSRKSEFDNEYAHIQLTELKKIATLGAGAFGRVDLVSYGQKTFALKIIKKIDIVKQDQVDHVYSEKHVMMKCRSSPFIIELFKTFRNDKFVYFLMEACMGGDVWTIMSQRRFFDEKTAKFIAGCVVEAFDFLHSHNIIYRDLKPENLMLSTDGYCKLVDFGFAKHIPPNQKTNTFAGTPEYVAPEIILDRGHDRAVDYWALGILVFELLVGRTPFRGQNQIKIYQQILGGIDVIQMPSKIPKSAQGLIKHLCKQLPAERLGYQRRGIQDIKRHGWFDSLDWQKLRNKQITSPIKRPLASNTDLQYFGPAGVENEHDPPDETSGWDIDF